MALLLALVIGGVVGAFLQRAFDRSRRARRRMRASRSTAVANRALRASVEPPAAPEHPAAPATADVETDTSSVLRALPPIEIPPELVKLGDQLQAQYRRQHFKVMPSRRPS